MGKKAANFVLFPSNRQITSNCSSPRPIGRRFGDVLSAADGGKSLRGELNGGKRGEIRTDLAAAVRSWSLTSIHPRCGQRRPFPQRTKQSKSAKPGERAPCLALFSYSTISNSISAECRRCPDRSARSFAAESHRRRAGEFGPLRQHRPQITKRDAGVRTAFASFYFAHCARHASAAAGSFSVNIAQPSAAASA